MKGFIHYWIAVAVIAVLPASCKQSGSSSRLEESETAASYCFNQLRIHTALDPKLSEKARNALGGEASINITFLIPRPDLIGKSGTDFSKDGWGAEIRVMLIEENKREFLQTYSTGKDKIDEEGEGDDVTSQYWRVELQTNPHPKKNVRTGS